MQDGVSPSTAHALLKSNISIANNGWGYEAFADTDGSVQFANNFARGNIFGNYSIFIGVPDYTPANLSGNEPFGRNIDADLP